MTVIKDQYTVLGRVVLTPGDIAELIKEAVRAKTEFASADLVIEPATIPAVMVEARESKKHEQ